MKKIVLCLLVILALGATANADIVFSGILHVAKVDDTVGRLNAIELWIDGTEDFTGGKKLQWALDGAGFAVVTKLYGGVYTDEFVYIIEDSDVDAFDLVFGSSFGDNRIINNKINHDGNDGYRFTFAGDDQVWKNNTTFVYKNSYMYRKDGTGPDGGWVPANWDNVQNNNLLKDMTASEIAAAVPFGTYQIPEPATMVLLSLGGLLLRRKK